MRPENQNLLLMRHEIVMPDIGAESQPIQFVQWLSEVGAEVIEGDRVAEVVTAGVLVYIHAGWSGILTSKFVSDGEAIQPGVVLGTIAEQEA